MCLSGTVSDGGVPPSGPAGPASGSTVCVSGSRSRGRVLAESGCPGALGSVPAPPLVVHSTLGWNGTFPKHPDKRVLLLS